MGEVERLSMNHLYNLIEGTRLDSHSFDIAIVVQILKLHYFWLPLV
jgi:hypothetical protein